MKGEIIFKEGDLVLPKDNMKIPENTYLPSWRCFKKLFENGPLPVKLTSDVECNCSSNNGNHLPNCAITQNGHKQMIVLDGLDGSQIQFPGSLFKKN